jgi:hypothetical protein
MYNSLLFHSPIAFSISHHRLTNRPMHTLTHRPLATPAQRFLLLHTTIPPNQQIRLIAINQILRRLTNIRNQPIKQIKRHRLSNYDTQDLSAVLVWGEWVVGDDVLFCAEQFADAFLPEMREFFGEFGGEVECYDGEAGVVILFWGLVMGMCGRGGKGDR